MQNAKHATSAAARYLESSKRNAFRGILRHPIATVAMAAILSGGGAVSARAGDQSTESVRSGKWGFDLEGMDQLVKPGDDFARYAYGKWYKNVVIPPDQVGAGTFGDVTNRTQSQLRTVLEESARRPRTASARLIGDLYAASLDEALVERLDNAPLKADLETVRSLADKAMMAEFMGRSHGAFGMSLFKADVQPDLLVPSRNLLRLGQSGLGLGERELYLSKDAEPLKAAYGKYIAATLTLAGWADPATQAEAILALETQIAEASWSTTDSYDRVKTYNPMTMAQLQTSAPGFSWVRYMRGAKVGLDRKISIMQPSAFEKIARIYARTPLDTLKAWEAFHIVDQASPYLSRRFSQNRFEFRDKMMNGLEGEPPSWKKALDVVNKAAGQPLGRQYVAKYFPPAVKVQMETLIADLQAAMAVRIQRVDWMSPPTKAAALRKLSNLRVMVGYPNEWRDFSGLRIRRDDLLGNMQRAKAFEWSYQREKLSKPVDRSEWLALPQEVDAYSSSPRIHIAFPAGYLQPPYFDPAADMAVNFGAVGAVIGHEIIHQFDDQGRKFDATGALRDWWAPEDSLRFEAAADRIVKQFDQYEVLPGVRVNGRLTLGENIADLGGLLLGLEAYHASLNGRPAPVLDGLTGDQRYFLAFSQVHRAKLREEILKQIAATDEHAPPRFRVLGPPRNIDAWYSAFNVQRGDAYYLEPQDRVRLW